MSYERGGHLLPKCRSFGKRAKLQQATWMVPERLLMLMRLLMPMQCRFEVFRLDTYILINIRRKGFIPGTIKTEHSALEKTQFRRKSTPKISHGNNPRPRVMWNPAMSKSVKAAERNTPVGTQASTNTSGLNTRLLISGRQYFSRCCLYLGVAYIWVSVRKSPKCCL